MPLGWLIFRTPRLNSQEVNWPKIETAWTPFALPVSGNKTPQTGKANEKGIYQPSMLCGTYHLPSNNSNCLEGGSRERNERLPI